MSISASHSDASSITWLDTSSVVPAVARAWNARQSSARSTGSSPTVGSSSTSSSGRPSSAVASETRERSPPDIDAHHLALAAAPGRRVTITSSMRSRPAPTTAAK